MQFLLLEFLIFKVEKKLACALCHNAFRADSDITCGSFITALKKSLVSWEIGASYVGYTAKKHFFVRRFGTYGISDSCKHLTGKSKKSKLAKRYCKQIVFEEIGLVFHSHYSFRISKIGNQRHSIVWKLVMPALFVKLTYLECFKGDFCDVVAESLGVPMKSAVCRKKA